MPTLEQLHNAYMASREPEYDDTPNEDEQFEVFEHWQPVALTNRDIDNNHEAQRLNEFNAQMAKLKAMKLFNQGR